MKSKLKLIKHKATTLFKQGLTPKEMSESIIVSALISTIPIIGIGTFMITAVALKRKLNLPIMISLSYLTWPIQILLIIPFIRIGEFVFSVPRNHHTLEEIVRSFENNFFYTLGYLSFELLCGLGGWFVTAVPVAIVAYFITCLFLKKKKSV